MLVSAWTVNVTVGFLFVRRVSDFQDLHVKVEVHAAERVKRRAHHRWPLNLRHPKGERLTLFGLRLKTHPALDGHVRGKARAGHSNRFDLLFWAVAFFGGNARVELVTNTLAHKLTLKARDNVSTAMEVEQGPVVFRTVQLLPFVVGQHIFKAHGLPVLDDLAHIAGDTISSRNAGLL